MYFKLLMILIFEEFERELRNNSNNKINNAFVQLEYNTERSRVDENQHNAGELFALR